MNTPFTTSLQTRARKAEYRPSGQHSVPPEEHERNDEPHEDQQEDEEVDEQQQADSITLTLCAPRYPFSW